MDFFDFDAVFSDTSEMFLVPAEPEAFSTAMIRLRVRKDTDAEIKCIGETFSVLMKKVRTENVFDFYEAPVSVGDRPVRYYFRIVFHGEVYFYGACGFSAESEIVSQPFHFIPGFHVPDFYKGAVGYQIFPDRFCNGDPCNDPVGGIFTVAEHTAENAPWDSPVMPEDTHRFYGGDLQGIIQKLDYLSWLGAEVLYLNPIFLSPSNHKYDTQDYRHIDPHLSGFFSEPGESFTKETYYDRLLSEEVLRTSDGVFETLMREAHRRNIRVILDGVFNHTGRGHYYMDAEAIYENRAGYLPGAKKNPESPYRGFYYFDSEDHYRGWWDYETLPKLRYEIPGKAFTEIMSIVGKWLRPPYRIDGWRLDVAADIGDSEEENHRFHQAFREVVKKENSEALILAEHYGNPAPWLSGKEWDSVMNYDGFMDPVGYFLTGVDKHCDTYREDLHGNGEAFLASYQINLLNFPMNSRLSAMNQLSNHDHARFLTRTKSETGRLDTKGSLSASESVRRDIYRIGVTMQMMLPGMATVYYGDETALPGWTDPDSRRSFPWEKTDWEMISFFRTLITLRKTHSALRTGSYKPLQGGKDYVSFGRFNEKEAFAVVINLQPGKRTVLLPVYTLGMDFSGKCSRIFSADRDGYNAGNVSLKIENGTLVTEVPACSVSVYYELF